MTSDDPFLTQPWPWNYHIEYVTRPLSAAQAKVIIDIMEGKPHIMRAEDLEEKEIKRIAEAIISDHAHDIEWLSITEMSSAMLEASYYPLEFDEEEKAWHRIYEMIKKAKVTITFDED